MITIWASGTSHVAGEPPSDESSMESTPVSAMAAKAARPTLASDDLVMASAAHGASQLAYCSEKSGERASSAPNAPRAGSPRTGGPRAGPEVEPRDAAARFQMAP